MFWAIGGLVVLLSLLVVLRPMLVGAGAEERRASYDVRVYRDQLREVDRDVARGVLTGAEAQALRLEVSRKLLAAAEAEEREAASRTAPPRASRLAAAALGLLAVAGTAGLYLSVGASALGDQPLRERLARIAEDRANRPGQPEAEAIIAANRTLPEVPPEQAALVAELEAAVRERPDDPESQHRLAIGLAAIGRLPEARAAQAQTVALLGEDATADDHVTLAALMISATGGYVSPEAETALSRALGLDATNPSARYFSGLALLQGGRPDLAYRLWTGLIEEGPPDAPWVQAAAAEIDAMAAMAEPPPEAAAPPPDSAADPAADLGGQQAMIEGMVASLGERLATEGGPPEDWAQLIRSLGVLGRTGEAAAIWAEAQEVFADNPGALAQVREAARTARLVQ